MQLSALTRPALTLSLVALLGTAGCTTPCVRPVPPATDARDHVTLQREVISDHHILWAANGHASEAIRATISWAWTPAKMSPQPKKRTVKIGPASRVQVDFQYGKGTLSGWTVDHAEYVSDD